MKTLALLLAAIALAALFAGCAQPAQPAVQAAELERAKVLCIQECFGQQAAGVDLSRGPCLSEEITKDWVCDAAHYPRQPVDDDPANQCPAYGKTAGHFVEVDPECRFVRAS